MINELTMTISATKPAYIFTIVLSDCRVLARTRRRFDFALYG